MIFNFVCFAILILANKQDHACAMPPEQIATSNEIIDIKYYPAKRLIVVTDNIGGLVTYPYFINYLLTLPLPDRVSLSNERVNRLFPA